jgi:hypothetical protein
MLVNGQEFIDDQVTLLQPSSVVMANTASICCVLLFFPPEYVWVRKGNRHKFTQGRKMLENSMVLMH